MFSLKTLSDYAVLAEQKMNLPYVSEDAIQIHFGPLTSFAHECIELDEIDVDVDSYSNFLLTKGEVLLLEGSNSIYDETAVWLLNPFDFVEPLENSL